jgi:hypothetical protein
MSIVAGIAMNELAALHDAHECAAQNFFKMIQLLRHPSPHFADSQLLKI